MEPPWHSPFSAPVGISAHFNATCPPGQYSELMTIALDPFFVVISRDDSSVVVCVSLGTSSIELLGVAVRPSTRTALHALRILNSEQNPGRRQQQDKGTTVILKHQIVWLAIV